MILAVLYGAGIGVGAWLLLAWAWPPPQRLATILARTRPSVTHPRVSWSVSPTAGWAVRIGAPAVRPLAALGLPTRRVRRDLAIVDRPIEHVLAEKAVAGVIGLLLPYCTQLALLTGGIGLSWRLPLTASLAGALLGFHVPDLDTRTTARQRRAAFRHALSAYLDLVRIALAGGAGIDAALVDAASIGDGWAFAHLRRTLHAAHLTRTTMWAALAELGTRLDIRELTELAAAVSLAGTEGARVRASLAAKATALRTHQLTDAETAAHAASERLTLPMVLMLIGYVLLIGYPGISLVLTTLH